LAFFVLAIDDDTRSLSSSCSNVARYTARCSPSVPFLSHPQTGLFLPSSSRLPPSLVLLCRPSASLLPCAPTVGLAVRPFFSLASPSSSPPFSHPHAHRPAPSAPPSSLPCIVHWRRFAGIAGWRRFINRAVRVGSSLVCECECVCVVLQRVGATAFAWLAKGSTVFFSLAASFRFSFFPSL
jgi:hypothetical protein